MLPVMHYHCVPGANAHTVSTRSLYYPRRILGTSKIRILILIGHLIVLDSDAALNAAWARRADVFLFAPLCASSRESPSAKR